MNVRVYSCQNVGQFENLPELDQNGLRPFQWCQIDKTNDINIP